MLGILVLWCAFVIAIRGAKKVAETRQKIFLMLRDSSVLPYIHSFSRNNPYFSTTLRSKRNIHWLCGMQRPLPQHPTRSASSTFSILSKNRWDAPRRVEKQGHNTGGIVLWLFLLLLFLLLSFLVNNLLQRPFLFSSTDNKA